MKLQELTLGQIEELKGYLGKETMPTAENRKTSIDEFYIGKKVIIRTCTAGVHFGEIVEKEKKEVILKNSRRLWRWYTVNNGISLSEVANHGVKEESKICETVSNIWLEAIEIIVCTEEAIKNIEGQNEYKA